MSLHSLLLPFDDMFRKVVVSDPAIAGRQDCNSDARDGFASFSNVQTIMSWTLESLSGPRRVASQNRSALR